MDRNANKAKLWHGMNALCITSMEGNFELFWTKWVEHIESYNDGWPQHMHQQIVIYVQPCCISNLGKKAQASWCQVLADTTIWLYAQSNWDSHQVRRQDLGSWAAHVGQYGQVCSVNCKCINCAFKEDANEAPKKFRQTYVTDSSSVAYDVRSPRAKNPCGPHRFVGLRYGLEIPCSTPYFRERKLM